MLVMATGFATLGYLAARAYRDAPPIPARVVAGLRFLSARRRRDSGVDDLARSLCALPTRERTRSVESGLLCAHQPVPYSPWAISPNIWRAKK
jgi:hypothetical protein